MKINLSLTAVSLTAALLLSAAPSASAEEFTILIYESDSELQSRTDAAKSNGYWERYNAFAAELIKAGALRGGSALSEKTAQTVRGKGSADKAVAGARLGGYFVIEAPSIEAASALAAKAPAAATAVEIRPHRPNPLASMGK